MPRPALGTVFPARLGSVLTRLCWSSSKLDAKKVILSGPAANDPEDCITDNSLGDQFIEIAKKLKKQYVESAVDALLKSGS